MSKVDQVDLSYYATHPTVRLVEATRLQGMVAAETICRRGLRGIKQYGPMFAGMLGYGLKEPVRAALIRSSYAWFRDGDEIFDNDQELPPIYKDKKDFSKRKRGLIERVLNLDNEPIIGDRVDILLVDFFSLAKRLKLDLVDESLAIWDTMELDGERAEGRRVLTQEELDDYFDKLDFACIGGALKVAGERINSKDLFDLSWAVRTMFNARDFPKDFKDGIINISEEEIHEFGVDLVDLEGKKTVEELIEYDPMREWYKHHVSRGLDFLQRGRSSLDGLNLRWETRYALNKFFVNPTANDLNQYAQMLAA